VLVTPPPASSTLFPYTTLFRSMPAIDNLKQKSDDQLEQQLGELKREQFNLRFQSATNQLEKPSRVREVRRTIARIMTLKNERSRSEEHTSELQSRSDLVCRLLL